MAIDLLKFLHSRRDKATETKDQPAAHSIHSSNDRHNAQRSLRAESQIDHSNDRRSPQKNTTDNSKIDTKVFSEMFNSRNPKALELGSRGPQVVELKKLLNGTRSLFSSKLDISSDVYDAQTAAAVTKFQRQHSLSRDLKVHDKPGLCVDGMAGLWTVTALLSKNGVRFSDKQAQALLPKFNRSVGENWFESDAEKVKPATKGEIKISSIKKEYTIAPHESQPQHARQISFREAIHIKPSPKMLGIAECVERNALSESSYACQQYVRYGLESQNLYFNGGHPPRAIDAPNRLARDPRFMEVVGVDPQKLDQLPKGAIVYYAMPGDRKDALYNPDKAQMPGHAQVALGNGRFGSDFKHSENVFSSPIREVRVFIPSDSVQQRLTADRRSSSVNKRSMSS